MKYKWLEVPIIIIFSVVLLFNIYWIANLWINRTSFMYETNSMDLYVALGTLLLALVTGFLALFSWFSIRQNNEREKKVRKEKLLNEIIEWASNIAKSAISRQSTDSTELWRANLDYEYHKSMGKYMEELISSNYNELLEAFKETNIRLDDVRAFLDNIFGGHGGNILAFKNYETEIVVSVEKLLKEAAKLKVKYIVT